MGSFNSTRWNGYRKKQIVDTSLSLDVNWLVLDVIGRDNMCRPDHVEYEVTWHDERSGRTGYADVVIDTFGPTPVVVISFIVPGRSGRRTARLYSQSVELVSSSGGFGGLRWWFHCPRCRRRVAKLYQPLHQNELACRHCYNLTYRSSQTSHVKRFAEKVASMAQWLQKLRKA